MDAHRSRSVKSPVQVDRWYFAARCAVEDVGNRKVVRFTSTLAAVFINLTLRARLQTVDFCNKGTIERYHLIRKEFDLPHSKALSIMYDALKKHSLHRDYPYEACLRASIEYMVCDEYHTIYLPIINGRCTYLNAESLFHINDRYRTRHEIPELFDILRIARRYGSESVSLASL